MEHTNTSTFVFIVKGEFAGLYEKNLLFLFTKIRTSLDFRSHMKVTDCFQIYL
jgi:hypothetical protein